jgi:hypothetical protein
MMGGKSEPPQTKQETTVKLGAEQQALMDLAMPSVLGLNPTEQAAAGQIQQGAATAGGLAGQAAGTQSKLMDPSFMLDVANNPYLQAANQVTTQQMTQNLNENILNNVRSGATQAGGMYSGGASRQGIAEGQAIGRTTSGISDAITKANYDAYNRGLTGLHAAVQGNPNVQGQQFVEGGANSAVGAQQRAIEQAQLDEEIRKFYGAQQLDLDKAQSLLALLQGVPGATTVTTGTGALPGGPSRLQGAAGGALSGAATGATVGSVIPGVGTAIGAGAGAVGGGLLGLLTGRA